MTGRNGRQQNRAYLVGKWLPKITGRCFRGRGVVLPELVLHWTEIMGSDMARFTLPVKVSGSARQIDPETGQAAGATQRSARRNTRKTVRKPSGAVLTVKVESFKAMELSYQAPQLVDRINAWFGFRAVDRLKFIQTPGIYNGQEDQAAGDGAVSGGKPSVSAAELERAERRLEHIDDERMRRALAKIDVGRKS